MDRHKIHVFSWIKSLSHSHINLLPIFIKVIFIHIESKWDISKQGFTLRLFVIWFTTIRCCQIFHTGPLKLVMLCVWWDWRRLYSCTVVTWWRSLIAQSLCCILYTHTLTRSQIMHTLQQNFTHYVLYCQTRFAYETVLKIWNQYRVTSDVSRLLLQPVKEAKQDKRI